MRLRDENSRMLEIEVFRVTRVNVAKCYYYAYLGLLKLPNIQGWAELA